MINKGWLSTASIIPSTHFNLRPDPQDISLLVIHNISLPPNRFGLNYVEDFFCGNLDPTIDPYFETIKQMKVSSHLYIKRDGLVVQFVALDKRAWHAGISEYKGRKNCNDFSIGIELEGTDDLEYTNSQYAALQAVTQELINEYTALNKARIVGHCHIAPGRKTDPGNSFDWTRYLASL
ncbi:1,6-anhydro-N-acetylmuramyl-L-alanine amidase AmpD [Aliikangiella sp. IMCC44359]|uniref:1,6-anhydro-N-acetylmuramyl-L-alanine amidase AmpD n=1 Tax=Aliikangiella sp. IMCC44359 TaxID=3459125 RepID=UPI00403A908B